MKKIIALLFLVSIGITVQAQNKVPEFLGTKTPYRPRQQKLTLPPAGYTAIYINYVGRHGSRFLTKAGSDVIVQQVLQKADEQQALTKLGGRLLTMVNHFLAVETGNYENITLAGELEQEGIGKRMSGNYPQVFRKQNGLDVVSTYKVRTGQSATAFLKGFGSYPAGKINRSVTVDSVDNVLRFYDLSPAYQDYKNSSLIKEKVDSLYSSVNVAGIGERVGRRIFNDVFRGQLHKGVEVSVGKEKKAITEEEFMTSLYELYIAQYCLAANIQQVFPGQKTQFGIAFNRADLQRLEYATNASDFMEKGPASDPLGIQARVAVPLLADFINSVDSVIAGSKKTDARLQFTHAEAISPFATLLGIPEASVASSSIYDYAKHWKASAIIPMSANIQWIVYKNGEDYLLKTLLNEKEVALPVSTTMFPYYRWVDVKEYYLQKLADLHAGETQDMQKYLRDLK